MAVLELKVQLLTVAAKRAIDLQKKLSAKDVELASTKSVLDTKEVTLREKVQKCDQLNYALGLARIIVGRSQRIIRDFSERVCTEYTSSMPAQVVATGMA